MIQSIITGSGSYIPENKIRKEDFLDKIFFDDDGNRIQKSTEEIIQKFIEITEIHERRYLDKNLMNSDMAKIAGEKAILQSGIDKEQLDYIIVAHNYGDISAEYRQVDITPSLSIRVKHKIGIKTNKCKAYDMIYGCPGWVEGLILADQLIKSKIAKKILVIGTETLSRAVDPHDRNSMIFADGAGAVILEAKETSEKIGILNHTSICDSNEEMNYICNSESLNPDYKGSKVNINMKGRKVYEYAITKVPIAMKCALDGAKIHIKDLKMIILHQANAKMDKAIIQRFFKLYDFETPPKGTEPMTIQYLGNSSVGTVPTMYDLINNKQIDGYEFKSGDIILLASVGAGMIINAVIYKFP